MNTALPGRHEDDEEIAATQQDGEEDEADEGEEEEEQEEEEEVAPRQAQVAPPPQEGVVEQGDVISQCLRVTGSCASPSIQGSASIACSSHSKRLPSYPYLHSTRQEVSLISSTLLPLSSQDSS